MVFDVVFLGSALSRFVFVLIILVMIRLDRVTVFVLALVLIFGFGAEMLVLFVNIAQLVIAIDTLSVAAVKLRQH
jgi:hypothetical protein